MKNLVCLGLMLAAAVCLAEGHRVRGRGGHQHHSHGLRAQNRNRAKRVPRAWFGPVQDEAQCAAASLKENGGQFDLQTEERPKDVCNQVGDSFCLCLQSLRDWKMQRWGEIFGMRNFNRWRGGGRAGRRANKRMRKQLRKQRKLAAAAAALEEELEDELEEDEEEEAEMEFKLKCGSCSLKWGGARSSDELMQHVQEAVGAITEAVEEAQLMEDDEVEQDLNDTEIELHA